MSIGIRVSDTVLKVAEEWHLGQWSALYSILSAGSCADREIASDAARELRRMLVKTVRDNNSGRELGAISEVVAAVDELEFIAEHGKELS